MLYLIIMLAMVIPGNGDTKITSNWYPYVKKKLEKLGIDVIAENMPDPVLARKKIWLPFIQKRINGDSDSVLIGHSSGAAAIMKFLESNKCRLAVLVGSYYTDLGYDSEKKSGYFDNPWQWDRIKANSDKIILFSSSDDPYIPISEPRLIKNKLNAEYHEYVDEGHFGEDTGKTIFPEIVAAVQKYIENNQ